MMSIFYTGELFAIYHSKEERRSSLNMRRRVIEVFLVVAVMTFAAVFSAFADQEKAAPITKMGGNTASAITASAPQPGWLERNTLTGDWGAVRTTRRAFFCRAG
jgi:heme/copper-type cytochrome/quinol oxidase subunit 3